MLRLMGMSRILACSLAVVAITGCGQQAEGASIVAAGSSAPAVTGSPEPSPVTLPHGLQCQLDDKLLTATMDSVDGATGAARARQAAERELARTFPGVEMSEVEAQPATGNGATGFIVVRDRRRQMFLGVTGEAGTYRASTYTLCHSFKTAAEQAS